MTAPVWTITSRPAPASSSIIWRPNHRISIVASDRSSYRQFSVHKNRLILLYGHTARTLRLSLISCREVSKQTKAVIAVIMFYNKRLWWVCWLLDIMRIKWISSDRLVICHCIVIVRLWRMPISQYRFQIGIKSTLSWTAVLTKFNVVGMRVLNRCCFIAMRRRLYFLYMSKIKWYFKKFISSCNAVLCIIYRLLNNDMQKIFSK